jgi:hypothetical protein
VTLCQRRIEKASFQNRYNYSRAGKTNRVSISCRYPVCTRRADKVATLFPFPILIQQRPFLYRCTTLQMIIITPSPCRKLHLICVWQWQRSLEAQFESFSPTLCNLMQVHTREITLMRVNHSWHLCVFLRLILETVTVKPASGTMVYI